MSVERKLRRARAAMEVAFYETRELRWQTDPPRDALHSLLAAGRYSMHPDERVMQVRLQVLEARWVDLQYRPGPEE
jgi:hypothetical protein